MQALPRLKLSDARIDAISVGLCGNCQIRMYGLMADPCLDMLSKLNTMAKVSMAGSGKMICPPCKVRWNRL